MDRATIEALASNVETTAEAEALARLIVREGKKPEVLVTMKFGNKRRRYVVEHEDRDEVLKFLGMDEEEREYNGRFFWFGGRWLRAYGKVDEMHRSLSMSEVVKIETADPKRVWGS